LVFSPDPSTTTVFCTTGDSTRSYDLKKLGPPSVFATNIDSNITSIAIAPNGSSIATVDTIGTLSLWDVATDKPGKVISNPKHSLQSVEFSPDGKSIVIAGGISEEEPVVQFHDALTGEVIDSLTGHTKYTTSATFSPDGKTLATGSTDRQIKLWDLITKRERLTMKGHSNSIRALSFSPDGNRLVSVGLEDRARVWDVKTGNQLFDIESY